MRERSEIDRRNVSLQGFFASDDELDDSEPCEAEELPHAVPTARSKVISQLPEDQTPRE